MVRTLMIYSINTGVLTRCEAARLMVAGSSSYHAFLISLCAIAVLVTVRFQSYPPCIEDLTDLRVCTVCNDAEQLHIHRLLLHTAKV